MNNYIKRLLLWKRLTAFTVIFITLLFLIKTYTTRNMNELRNEKAKAMEDIPKVAKLIKSNVTDGVHGNAMDEASSDNVIRLKRIKDVCSKFNLGKYKMANGTNYKIKYPPTPQYSVFYYDLEDNFAFCPIYKSASSTWLHNLCLLAGETEESLKNTKSQLTTIARRLFPEINDVEQAKGILESSKKLIVVRHPFERILSAYRDKLENINTGWEHGTGHFYRKYGAKIVKKYRPGGNRSVAMLKPGTYIWDKTKARPAGIEPTFKEFVSYLLDTDLLYYADDHWIPYNLFCTPCHVDYDYIAKVETLSRDQIFILNKLGWSERIQPKWRHKTSSEKNINDLISKTYFSQLSPQEVELLYDKYKLDFEMFNYSPSLYYSYAKDVD